MIVKYIIRKEIFFSLTWLLVCIVVGSPHAWSQKSCYLIYEVRGNQERLAAPLISNHAQIDSTAGKKIIQNTILGLHKRGYVTASVDSLYWKPDTLHVVLYIGRIFKWTTLRTGNVSASLLREIGYQEKMYRGRPLRYETLVDLEEKILDYSDNRGYPFATIQLDSVQIENHVLSASLKYIPGVKIFFDTLRVSGTARLRHKFLENWLKLLPGQPYSQNRLEQAYLLLQQQPYLKMTRAYEVVFKNDRAYITFYADATRASEGNGLIGLLPNEQEKGKLLLTGEVNLRLRNLFNAGGTFALNWQQIRKGSPRLAMAYTQPALLGTPLELQVGFQLLREDSVRRVQQGFLTLTQQLNIFYYLSSHQKIGAGIERRSSRLAESDTLQINGNLLAEAETNWLGYQFYYDYNQLDDFFFPRQGWEIHASVGIGNKKLTDPFIPKGTQEISTQLVYKASLRRYTPIGKQSSLLVQLQGGQIFNNNLFRNDLFRLGGLTSLRGFNENFFFASDFVVSTLEYRFFWEKTSYVFAFYDQAWIQTRILQTMQKDFPLGMGAGVSFRTPAGVFSLVYALGQSDDRAFGLNFSKIHFGLSSLF